MEDLNVVGLVQFLKQHASNEHPHQRLVPGMAVRPLECTWCEPATEQEVDAFAAEHGWYFPEDYKQFLLLHNGAILFQHPYYGGGTELLSLEKIAIISKDCDIPAHCYPIAWTDQRIGAVCIDSEKCRKGEKPYLFFLDAMDQMEDAIFIPLTFTEWFERLVICQGEEFWNWR